MRERREYCTRPRQRLVCRFLEIWPARISRSADNLQACVYLSLPLSLPRLALLQIIPLRKHNLVLAVPYNHQKCPQHLIVKSVRYTVRVIRGRLYGRQLTGIDVYSSPFLIDAIDTGSNKSAIVACNKLLKKQPQNDLVKVRPSCVASTSCHVISSVIG